MDKTPCYSPPFLKIHPQIIFTLILVFFWAKSVVAFVLVLQYWKAKMLISFPSLFCLSGRYFASINSCTIFADNFFSSAECSSSRSRENTNCTRKCHRSGFSSLYSYFHLKNILQLLSCDSIYVILCNHWQSIKSRLGHAILLNNKVPEISQLLQLELPCFSLFSDILKCTLLWQIRLWESDLNRVEMTPAHYYDEFPSRVKIS